MYDIGKLHSVLVEILDYFVDICVENNLRYFLLYGTALGAYRHGGFIPWDDDLDVGMPREDYNKFISIMGKKKDSIYSIQNECNEKKWFLTFSKLRKTNTVYIESIADGIYRNNGIYIDIFPLEYSKNYGFGNNIKKTFIKYLIHGLKLYSCKELYKEKLGKKYFLHLVISFPVGVSIRHSLLLLNKISIGKINEDEAKYFNVYDDMSSIKKDIYFPPKTILFCGKEYCCPNNIQQYLETIYGSTYMQLPPENERRTHDPIKIQF